MKHNYKNAMNKISADGDFEKQLLARLEREQARIDLSEDTLSPRRFVRRFKLTVPLAAVAAVVAMVMSLRFALPSFLKREVKTQNITVKEKASQQAVEQTSVQSDEISDVTAFSGSSAVSLAQNLSMRIVEPENAITYNTNIFFTFEGFDKYDIELSGSCIVFETTLPKNYTLSNFFEDYYNLITNATGVTVTNNGLLQSFFNIYDSSIHSISVFDGTREIIDLDTALMSEYKDKSNIHFTISIT